MTAPTIELLVGKFTDWLKHRRELSEIRQMNRADIELIASDLRVSADDLDRLIEAGPHSADEMPEIDVTLVQTLEPTGPFGAKAVAEIPKDGIAPAIANAIYNATSGSAAPSGSAAAGGSAATGLRLRRLPFTPERVWRALHQR